MSVSIFPLLLNYKNDDEKKEELKDQATDKAKDLKDKF
ncbi:putative uncharacterized protein [Staphylococcus equorum subsp. equorum Mu2]|nr:putative uncharacterized protein [Staphylococcus equorum subsp. equorum Mu2]